MLRHFAILLGLLRCVASLDAATFVEDFSGDPAEHGWRTFGDTGLFRWDAANQNLAVTWDSSRTNSYWYRPLDTVLARDDDFTLAFDLRVDDAGATGDPVKPFAFELAVGFLNLAEATRAGFRRGTGVNSPDLVEFDYFWDAGFGATLWPVCIGTNHQFNYNGRSDFAVTALAPGEWHRVVMNFTATNQTLVTTVTNLAAQTGLTITDPLAASFTDFRVDAISISSYSDAGSQDSIRAHGAVANLSISTPAPPVQAFIGAWTNGAWQLQIVGRPHWRYTIERSDALQAWYAVSSAAVSGTGRMQWTDTNAPPAGAFYRVRADRP